MKRNTIISKCLCILCLLGVFGSVVSGDENQDMIEQVKTILNYETLSREQKAEGIQQLGNEGRDAFIHLVKARTYECVPSTVVYATQDLGISELAPYILDMMGESQYGDITKIIMETLQTLQNSEVNPELIKIIRSDAWSRFVKWRTAQTLLVLGSPDERAEAAEYFKEYWDNWDSSEYSIHTPLDAADIVRELGPPEYAQDAIAFLYSVWENTDYYYSNFFQLGEDHFKIMWRLEDPDIQTDLLDRVIHGGIDAALGRAVEAVITRNDERFIPLLRKALTGESPNHEPHLWTLCYRILMENYDPGVVADKEWMLNSYRLFEVRFKSSFSPEEFALYTEPLCKRIIEYFGLLDCSLLPESEDTTSP